jgi:bifunctional non-homologous end joining protein LigD
MAKDEHGAPQIVEVAGREIRLSNPDKPYFPDRGITKGDLLRYYLEVGEAVLRGVRDRPMTLYRWPGGVEGDPFYQKRIPKSRPEWIESMTITFPSGRSAEMLVGADVAHIAWAVTLGCIDLNPWPIRREDPDRPDELRVDLDPTPGVPFEDVREVAMVVREVLEEHDLVGWPKTSGKRGIHIGVRIEPRWGFTDVRRAALALSREVERRMPEVATTAWWKEEREGVFLDYNQNARDRTVASAYSVRPVPDARVSCPLAWEEVPGVDPAELRLDTVPGRLRERGDPAEGMDDEVGVLDALLDLAERDEKEGLGDAPWPPHFPKGEDEPVRAAPSRRRKGQGRGGGRS